MENLKKLLSKKRDNKAHLEHVFEEVDPQNERDYPELKTSDIYNRTTQDLVQTYQKLQKEINELELQVINNQGLNS